jgi:hypothetical protein
MRLGVCRLKSLTVMVQNMSTADRCTMFGPVMQFLPELETFDIIKSRMDFSKAYSGTRRDEFTEKF